MVRPGGPLSGSLAWSPPTYEVDDEGKVVGATNHRQPNNWGRWGEHDQRGTVNFLTPDLVAAAARLIQTGQVISCAIPLDQGGPIHPTRVPVVHLYSYSGTDMVGGAELTRAYPGFQGTDDYLFMPVQGTTQWDGLSHFGHEDTIYNGFWMGNVEGHMGAKRCSIHLLSDSLVGRGVLLDLPRHLGVERLEGGRAIASAELDACAVAQGVELRRGDIVLIRTGHVPWYYELRRKHEFWRGGAPGLAMDAATWAHEREMAAIAMDNIAIEVEPFASDEQVYPLHSRLIRDLGLTLGEVWWLEDLADACEAAGRYEFFLSAPPLNITNASGSMLNPVAIL